MDTNPDSWRRISSRQIADCRVFQVREDLCQRDPDGTQAKFFVLENPDWVNIIALTKEKEVVLINQFRHGLERAIIEIPGGMVDAGEDPQAAAKRELREETGYTSENWKLLGRSHPNPAIQNNSIYHFLAVDCEQTDETAFDAHEHIVTSLVPLTEIERLVFDGKITHSLVIAAFYYLNQLRHI